MGGGNKKVRGCVKMKSDYWNEFMHTGRIEDYLCYKNQSEAVVSADRNEKNIKQAGVEKRERNDNRDRDGAFSSTNRGI